MQCYLFFLLITIITVHGIFQLNFNVFFFLQKSIKMKLNNSNNKTTECLFKVDLKTHTSNQTYILLYGYKPVNDDDI